VLSIAAMFPWRRIPSQLQVFLVAAYAVLASVLLAIVPTTIAPVFPFLAAALAGSKLTSRRAAIGVAVTGALSTAVALWIAGHTAHVPGEWAWWLGLTVGLPVWVGMSRRDRREALASARRAAAEAERAKASEAREAALRERGRIAREIHDVLGHSLSGIALQLEAAEALSSAGREDEAALAVRKARALAVDSITETRRAVHALREDTLPLPETLRGMAAGDSASFQLLGDAGPVPAETVHTVVRTAQEALTNAARHAPGADRAMTLEFTRNTVSLTVTNGPARNPRPPEAAVGTSMGLIGMRERAALLGGTLRAGPSAEGDWTDENSAGGSAAGAAADGEAAAGGWTVRLEVPR
jgi:signal transduction histidine kinase